MIFTKALISILRLHDQFPFSVAHLRRILEVQGLAEDIEDEFGRIHAQHQHYLQLTGSVLRIFDDLQRQREVSEPISSNAIYLALLVRAQQGEATAPDRQQIDHVLAFLSNPVLDVLAQEDDGYVLTISPGAAQERLGRLENLLSSEE